MPTTREVLEDLLEGAKTNAVEIAEGQEHQPMVMFVKGGRLEEVIGMSGAPPHRVLPGLLAIHQPDGYLLVIEGRILKAPAGFDQGGGADFAPGEISDNIDNPTVLVITAVDRLGWRAAWTCEALTEEFPRLFKPWTEIPFEGRLVITEW